MYSGQRYTLWEDTGTTTPLHFFKNQYLSPRLSYLLQYMRGKFGCFNNTVDPIK